MEKMRICVIGAGAAGLCAARHLAGQPNKFKFEVFEKNAVVGGTWVYTDKVGIDDDGLPIYSSIYKHLRTNIPMVLMQFPDYPQEKYDPGCCVQHEVVLEYLQNYAKHFNLDNYIQFNTMVESVKPEPSNKVSDSFKWKVTVKNLKTSEITDLWYDAVIVCNGHYFNPYIPNIPGLNHFRGQVLHSHDYRTSEVFTGKKIILLGGAPSGIDISIELHDEIGAHVFLSHNHATLPIANSTRYSQVKGIDRFEDEEFLLKDGSRIKADVLIFCTGYNYSFPFLDKSCGITIDDNFVHTLYKFIINTEYPTMGFIGIPQKVLPFPLFHIQVQYFLASLLGRVQLPTKELMLEDAKLHGVNKRHAYMLAELMAGYVDDLSEASSITSLPDFQKFGHPVWRTHIKDLRTCKDQKFVVKPDGSFEILKPPVQ